MGNTAKLSGTFKSLKHYLTIKIAMQSPIFFLMLAGLLKFIMKFWLAHMRETWYVYSLDLWVCEFLNMEVGLHTNTSISLLPGGESQCNIKISFMTKGKKNWCISYFKIYTGLVCKMWKLLIYIPNYVTNLHLNGNLIKGQTFRNMFSIIDLC